MKSAVFIAGLLLTGCINWNHHEQMQPHWTSSPQQSVDCYTKGEQMTIHTTYTGENIYVQNPVVYCDDSTERYCAYEVLLNNSTAVPRDSLAQSIFMIRLNNRGLQQGDSIHLVIHHYNGGMPVLLNPETR
jgi:hypothetical protein